jgi:chemotaxis protein CheD
VVAVGFASGDGKVCDGLAGHFVAIEMGLKQCLEGFIEQAIPAGAIRPFDQLQQMVAHFEQRFLHMFQSLAQHILKLDVPQRLCQPDHALRVVCINVGDHFQQQLATGGSMAAFDQVANEVLPEVYVQPEESRLVREPTILRTLLGSCVGIAFRIPRLGVGALCHPMLPRSPTKSTAILNRSAGCRYVDFAIQDLARHFNRLGASCYEVEVKLFGGGDVLLTASDDARPSVGKLNIEAAMKVLDEEGFAVSASSLGGKRGVNIRFNTQTGEVLLQRYT